MKSTASRPSGFSVPSTKPIIARWSKFRKPCTSSTTVTASPSAPSNCVASSKHRSIVSARMCSRMSPGVAIATRSPPPNSRNGCSDAGRGSPNSVSHAAAPKPHTHDSLPSGTRLPTERTSAATSLHHARMVSAWPAPGFTVATTKIALRVIGLWTACGSGEPVCIAGWRSIMSGRAGRADRGTRRRTVGLSHATVLFGLCDMRMKDVVRAWAAGAVHSPGFVARAA
ncbi:hypothetical protein BVIET440_80099 [Burkholderia vietnamiensis]